MQKKRNSIVQKDFTLPIKRSENQCKLYYTQATEERKIEVEAEVEAGVKESYTH